MGQSLETWPFIQEECKRCKLFVNGEVTYSLFCKQSKFQTNQVKYSQEYVNCGSLQF